MNQKRSIRSTFARTATFALGVSAVLYTSYRVGQAIAEWRQFPVTPAVNFAAGFAVNPLADALREGGRWSFADLDWNIRSQIIPIDSMESKIDALMESLPKTDANLGRRPNASPELLRFIKNSNLNSTARDGAE